MTPDESASLAATLLAIDPQGLGGACLRTPRDARLDAWLKRLRDLLPDGVPLLRVASTVSEQQLFGGLDIAATLRRGVRTAQPGVLERVRDGVLVVSMAERLAAGTASRIGASLDARPAALVALDEGLDEEAVPVALGDRLAFHVAIRELDPRQALEPTHTRHDVARARRRYPRVALATRMIEQVCEACEALGVVSPRVQIFAARAARAAAALRGARGVAAEDVVQAILLVVLPRATRLPAADTEPRPSPPQEPASEEAQAAPAEQTPAPATAAADRTVNAALARLPADVLERLRPRLASRAATRAGRAGVKMPSGSHGRPMGCASRRAARPARLDLVATLQAAVPWQRLRARRPGAPLRLQACDLRYTRFKQHSRTLVVFAVDASGSSALHRLAEAKGAIELILAECYVRRDEVAVVGFRQRSAQVLLPPTRSLVRAKRELAGLPGGGGTPLPAGIAAARDVALAARRRGSTPHLVVLTDGHANIDLSGSAGREAARRDALRVARQVASDPIATLLIDTAPRPQALAQELSNALGAEYVPLPSSDAAQIAARLRRSVQDARA